MMLDLYLNVTLASVTKALEPLMSSVTRRVIKGLEKRGVSANYLTSLYRSLDGGASKIEYKPKVDFEPNIKPDFGGGSWDSKEVRDALKDTYGDDIADTLYEFGEDGVELAEKYGNELGGGLGGLGFNDGRKALELINKYGDEALELLGSGKNVDEVAEMLGGSGSGTVGGGSAFARNNLQSILANEGIPLNEFNTLRLTNVDELSTDQIAKMKNIRDAVPAIDESTMIQKTNPLDDIEKYIGEDGYNFIRGYIARYDDVSYISGYDNIVESLRLDYTTNNGIRPYPEDGNAYGYIKFKTYDVDQIEIPYGKAFGGTNMDLVPCTRNGFTGARNGEIIPEWMVDGNLEPIEGAELHKVIDSKDSIVAIFDGEHFREVVK